MRIRSRRPSLLTNPTPSRSKLAWIEVLPDGGPMAA